MSSPIDWTTSPEPVRPGNKLDLVRCKSGSLPPMVCLSTRHIGTEIHWWGGRSYPHLQNGCPACADKRPAVWKGWIAAWQPKTRDIVILEFTTRCTEPLDAYFLAHGTCRGGIVTLSRSGSKPNGKLSLQIVTGTYAVNELPECPNIKTALEMMWVAKRFDDDIQVEPGRPVIEPAMSNDELAKRRPDRAAGIDRSRFEQEIDRRAAKRNGHPTKETHADLVTDALGTTDSAPKQIPLTEAGKMLADEFKHHARFATERKANP